MNLLPVAALRTLRASRWEMMMARLFGRKIVTEDCGKRVVCRRWRGRIYMTDFG